MTSLTCRACGWTGVPLLTDKPEKAGPAIGRAHRKR
jgi:hypothetical protein